MSDFERIRSMGKSDFQNRRKKSDWIVGMAAGLSVFSWVISIAVIFVLGEAYPGSGVGWFESIGRMWGAPIQADRIWDRTLLQVSLVMLFLSFVMCVVGFFFNKMRMRRKTDKYRKSIFIMAGLAVLGIVVFILRFGWPF